METISNYEKQATDFLKKTNTTIEITYKKHDYHFIGDTDKRDIYAIVIKRGGRKMEFDFGNSLAKSGFYVMMGRKRFDFDRKHLNVNDQKLRYLAGAHQSCDKIHRPVPPTAYDILACLTKYNPGTFNDFCSEYGYNEDSKNAEKIYNSVVTEYLQVTSLFNEKEMKLLYEIN